MIVPDDIKAPKVLTVVFANTWRTRIAINHENEWIPYPRRTVQIQLTEEQRKALVRQKVGEDYGAVPVYEEIENVWFEPEGGDNDENRG